MRYHPFGSTDLDVSELGLGCSNLHGTLTGASSGETAERLVHEALDQGITFFDTADSYGNGTSEELLGAALEGRRDRVVIASKAGFVFSTTGGLAWRLKPLLKPMLSRLGVLKGAVRRVRAAHKNQDFSPEHLIDAVEGSLRRLRTDYLDILQLHSPPSDVIERGDFVEPLERLRAQGKIRYWGIACDTTDDALRALHYPEVRSIQLELNLINQEALAVALPQAHATGRGVIARQVLASGFLARPVADLVPDFSVYDDAFFEARKRAAAPFQALITPERTLPQAALQFVRQQPGVSVTLIGTGKLKHLHENIAALDAPSLTSDDLLVAASA